MISCSGTLFSGYSQDEAEKSISRGSLAANCGLTVRGAVVERVASGCVMGRGEPSWQPIGGLPVIASLIDGGLSDGREHYATLLEARPKPYVLDDATIAATKRVNGEGLEWCGVYDEQLRRCLRYITFAAAFETRPATAVFAMPVRGGGEPERLAIVDEDEQAILHPRTAHEPRESLSVSERRGAVLAGSRP